MDFLLLSGLMIDMRGGTSEAVMTATTGLAGIAAGAGVLKERGTVTGVRGRVVKKDAPKLSAGTVSARSRRILIKVVGGRQQICLLQEFLVDMEKGDTEVVDMSSPILENRQHTVMIGETRLPISSGGAEVEEGNSEAPM